MDTLQKESGAAPTAQQPGKEVEQEHPRQWRRHGTVIVLVGGLAVFLIGFGAGWIGRTGHTIRHMAEAPAFVKGGFSDMPQAGFGRHMGGDVNPTDGTAITRLSGVVTKVNGDTFTIAGNGTTKTIKTTADTEFNTNDSKVDVNDSVTVRGTQDGDTFTAKQVTIFNN